MGTSSLHDLLLVTAATTVLGSRIPLTQAGAAQVGAYAAEVRDGIESAIELLAKLNGLAKRGAPAGAELDDEVAAVIEDLHQYVCALNTLQDLAAEAREDA